MPQVNWKRIWLGTLVGGVVWCGWSSIINMGLLMSRYAAAQKAGTVLVQPRYPFFIIVWFLTLFLLAFVLAWLYAGARRVFGAGPKTALAVGILVGFAAGFPVNFSLAAWAPMGRGIPLGWLVDMWVGAALTALVAGWLYRD